MTGDGRPELVVVRLPPLTPLQQLAILMESRVTATVLAYSLAENGGSAPAPVASVEIPIQVTIAVGDQARRAEVRDLVAFSNGKVLLAPPGGRARLIAIDGGAEAPKGDVPAGAWVDPLRPACAGATVHGILRSADGARLVRFALD
jgi:hypothetical protein